MSPTNGAFARLGAAGFMILLANDGSVLFRPRPDLPQNANVLADYNSWARDAQSTLAAAVRARGPDVLLTHVGRVCWCPVGYGTLIAVDVVTGLAQLQLQDQAQTVKTFRSQDIAPPFA